MNILRLPMTNRHNQARDHMMNNEKRAASEEKVRYVENLTPAEEYPEGDSWLTLTDAARVTKRQDKTIRDWVQSGKLPVRPLHLGINKRTRQVRASDLEQLTPILDRTAAITTEAGQIYLASIPAELKQIRTDHQQLIGETAHLQEALQVYEQTFTQRLADQRQQQQRDLEALRSSWQQQFDQAHTETLEAFDALGQKLAEQQGQQRQDLEALSMDWQQRLDKMQKALHTEVEQQSLWIDAQQKDIRQLMANHATLDQAVKAVERDREALLQEMATAFARQEQQREQLRRDLEREIQETEQRQQNALAMQILYLREAFEQQTRQIEGAEQALVTQQAELSQHMQRVEERLECLMDRLTSIEQSPVFQAGYTQAQEAMQKQLAQLTQAVQRLVAQQAPKER
jgi:hypothetical protein